MVFVIITVNTILLGPFGSNETNSECFSV